MANIHPSAVIDPGAELADGVDVGPLCYVGPDVRIGAGTRLISQVTILGPTDIGCRNTVWPHATLGGQAQDLKYKGEKTRLVVGDDNEIRENVTMHRGTAHDLGVTRVGNHNLVMAYVHIAHDCTISDDVIIASYVALAGHVRIERCAVIGGASAAHHFVTIGQYAYVGGMTRLVHDVPPFMVVEGNPATVRGANVIGLTRHGFDPETIKRLKDAYRRLFRDMGAGGRAGQTAAALTELEALHPGDETIATLVLAVRNSGSGHHGRYRESLRHDDPRQRTDGVTPDGDGPPAEGQDTP